MTSRNPFQSFFLFLICLYQPLRKLCHLTHLSVLPPSPLSRKPASLFIFFFLNCASVLLCAGWSTGDAGTWQSEPQRLVPTILCLAPALASQGRVAYASPWQSAQ